MWADIARAIINGELLADKQNHYPPLPIRKKLNIFALHFNIATLNDIDY